MLAFIGTITFPIFTTWFYKKTCRYINSLLQHSYISKILTLKSDAQYSEPKQTRLQNHKTIIQTQNKINFI